MTKSNLKKCFTNFVFNVFILTFVLSGIVHASTVEEVRQYLKYGYVEEVSPEVLNKGSVEEMLKALGDPYTAHFTKEEYEEFIDSIDNSFTGIGVYFDIEKKDMSILNVIDGSPAQKAGLQKGDKIIKIDGKEMKDLSFEKATNYIRGLENTFVELTIEREKKTFVIKVQRAFIELPTVESKIIENSIGYVNITSFGKDTGKEFESVLWDLEKKKVKSYIIDLRGNPGGYITTALDIAGYFIGKEVALQTKDNTFGYEVYRGKKHEFLMNKPVIFLIDEYSASASEILAAAIKDHKKALILGTKSYGKGTVQNMYVLGDGSALKMTVSYFYSPLQNPINKIGISPNITIKDKDPLDKAVSILKCADGNNIIKKFKISRTH